MGGNMEEITNLKELYQLLKPAFAIKLRLLRHHACKYIDIKDIWNYLYETKWYQTSNLELYQMVNDIIHLDENIMNKYLIEKLMHERNN